MDSARWHVSPAQRVRCKRTGKIAYCEAGGLGAGEFPQLVAKDDFAGAAALPFEPSLEFGDFNPVESGLFPDFDTEGAEVEGIFAAPVGAAELAEGDDGGFIEGFGGEGDGMVDAFGIAEGDDALFGAVRHKGSVAYSLFVRQSAAIGNWAAWRSERNTQAGGWAANRPDSRRARMTVNSMSVWCHGERTTSNAPFARASRYRSHSPVRVATIRRGLSSEPREEIRSAYEPSERRSSQKTRSKACLTRTSAASVRVEQAKTSVESDSRVRRSGWRTSRRGDMTRTRTYLHVTAVNDSGLEVQPKERVSVVRAGIGVRPFWAVAGPM